MNGPSTRNLMPAMGRENGNRLGAPRTDSTTRRQRQPTGRRVSIEQNAGPCTDDDLALDRLGMARQLENASLPSRDETPALSCQLTARISCVAGEPRPRRPTARR